LSNLICLRLLVDLHETFKSDVLIIFRHHRSYIQTNYFFYSLFIRVPLG
jgi:hypothetical protein